uniref:Reverse transcriptase domain-containing protein n=1 Tax=Haemonchus contortus TaxID=6289 RepID=A0A7I4YDH8_HAECO
MKIVVVIERQKYHLFSTYAPHTGCSEQTKDTFWNMLDEKTIEVPLQEALLAAGDLNGHVGATKDGYSCHGGFGYGSRNTYGERNLEYADSHNFAIVNTRFRKRDSHLITFYSGENRAQTDFVLVRHRDHGLVTDIAPPKPKLAERCEPARIKLWRLKEKEEAVVSSILLPAVTTVDETWKGAAEAITPVARSKLGVTKPGRRKLDKQTWLWTDHVGDKRITVDETITALKKMKSGKATGPDDLVAVLWKSKGWNPAGWLTEFFNQKAFDRVPRDVIWYALRQHGVPEELIEWVRILYTSPKGRAQTAAGTSTEFPISVGVHQGSALYPLLFVVVTDAITKDPQKPAPWTLPYADDVMLASEDKSELESQVQTWSDRLAMFGLRLNVKKTEYLTTNSSEPGSIKNNGTELTRTTTFKNLGSAIASDGSLGFETNSRNRYPAGRDIQVYGAECWPATKEVEARLSVMGTKMLRWAAGVTRLDRISNDAIREQFGVAPIVDKMREARLRWYGHTLSAKNDSFRKIGLNLDVSGNRPRERPKQR